MVHRKYKDYHKNIDGVEYKQCKECLKWFAMNNDNFGVDNKNKDKYNVRCKKCNHEYNDTLYLKDRDRRIAKAIKWWEDHKERHRESHRRYEGSKKHKAWSAKNYQMYKESQSQWRKDNPEKCREYSKQHRKHDITDSEWKNELEVFNYECAYCGITEEESLRIHKQVLHKDHADHTGANDLRNSIPACRSCNSGKHQDDIEEWYKERDFYDEDRFDKIIWWLTEGYIDFIEEKPPYRIIKKKNDHNNKFHHELWLVDDMRNFVECIDTKIKKKEIIKDIEEGILSEFLIHEVAK